MSTVHACPKLDFPDPDRIPLRPDRISLRPDKIGQDFPETGQDFPEPPTRFSDRRPNFSRTRFPSKSSKSSQNIVLISFETFENLEKRSISGFSKTGDSSRDILHFWDDLWNLVKISSSFRSKHSSKIGILRKSFKVSCSKTGDFSRDILHFLKSRQNLVQISSSFRSKHSSKIGILKKSFKA